MNKKFKVGDLVRYRLDCSFYGIIVKTIMGDFNKVYWIKSKTIERHSDYILEKIK